MVAVVMCLGILSTYVLARACGYGEIRYSTYCWVSVALILPATVLALLAGYWLEGAAMLLWAGYQGGLWYLEHSDESKLRHVYNAPS